MGDSTDAERLLLKIADLGILLNNALVRAVDRVGGSRDLIENGVVDVLIRLDLYGPMRPGDVGSITGLSSGGVTKLLDRLEAESLLVRRYGEISGDARGVEIRITRTGARMARDMADAFVTQLDAVEVFVKELDTMLPEFNED